eukprot:403358753
MSGENDYLFQNFDTIITVDYNKLKMMLGELHKTQKRHQDTLLEILSRKIVEIETNAYSNDMNIKNLLEEVKSKNENDRANIDQFQVDLQACKDSNKKFEDHLKTYEDSKKSLDELNVKMLDEIDHHTKELEVAFEEIDFVKSSLDVIKRKQQGINTSNASPSPVSKLDEQVNEIIQQQANTLQRRMSIKRPSENALQFGSRKESQGPLNIDNQVLLGFELRINELERAINPFRSNMTSPRGSKNEDAYQMERESFQKKKENGLFNHIDHQERKLFPQQFERSTKVNDDILQELYNRYTMLVDELDAYKSKILYFLQTEDNDQSPEFLMEKKTINFRERIARIESWQEKVQAEQKKLNTAQSESNEKLAAIQSNLELIDTLNNSQKQENERVLGKLSQFDMLLLDNDRIIKMANLYTEECVMNLKKNIESQVSEAAYKISRLDSSVDEQMDKIKKSIITREDVAELEGAICQRIELDFIHEKILLIDTLQMDLMNFENFVNQMNQDVDQLYNDVEMMQQQTAQTSSFQNVPSSSKPKLDHQNTANAQNLPSSPVRTSRKDRALQLKSNALGGNANQLSLGGGMPMSSGVQQKIKQLEDQVSEMYEKMKEKEFMNDFFQQQAAENGTPQNPSDSNIQNITHSPIDVQGTIPKQIIFEVSNLKNIMAKQQMQMNKFQIALGQLDQNKSKNDYDKLLKMQKENYELLRKYIDEVNQYSSDLYQKLQIKLNLKADQDFFEKFKQNVEDKVITDLNQKMDKIDHKRMQNSLKKKIDTLEDKLIKGVKQQNLNSSFTQGGEKELRPKQPLFTKNNNICISCNQTIGDGHKKQQSFGQGGGFKASTVKQNKNNMLKDLQTLAPKLGAGFSRILSKLDKPELVDMLMNKVGRQNSVGHEIIDRKAPNEELNITQNQSIFMNQTLQNNSAILFNNQNGQNYQTLNHSRSSIYLQQQSMTARDQKPGQISTFINPKSSLTLTNNQNSQRVHKVKNRRVESQGFLSQRNSVDREKHNHNQNHLRLPPVLLSEQANLQ